MSGVRGNIVGTICYEYRSSTVEFENLTVIDSDPSGGTMGMSSELPRCHWQASSPLSSYLGHFAGPFVLPQRQPTSLSNKERMSLIFLYRIFAVPGRGDRAIKARCSRNSIPCGDRTKQPFSLPATFVPPVQITEWHVLIYNESCPKLIHLLTS